MIHEEQDLPCILDDFPNYRLKTSKTTVIQEKQINVSDEQFRNERAFEYLEALETVLRLKFSNPQQKQQATDQALNLYDNQFNKVLANTTFRGVEFPTAELIEQKFDTDFDQTTKLFYNETCFRHSFSKLQSQQFNIEVASNSWVNYGLLFDTLVENKNNFDLPIPTTWIWDILDEFVYQFYMCSRWRKAIKGDDVQMLENFTKKASYDFWNLDHVIKQLITFVTRSDILNTSFNLEVEQLQTFHYLGFYALLALVKVYVMVGQFDKALETVSQINYKYLIVYSRSGGAYQTLFTYAGFSYLMQNRYREAVTLFQAIVLFYNKYKQLYSKSFQFDQMNKNYEKIVCLLAVSLVFYPEPMDDTIKSIFKETKIKPKERKEMNQPGEAVFDKFEKLNKYDIQTFQDLFFFASPKIVQAVQNLNDFKDTKVEQNDLLNEQKDKLQEELLKIQKINNISQILRLYTKLTTSKSAKLLKISEDEFKALLNLYQQRSQGVLMNSPFEQTILKRFESVTTMLNFKLENDVITVIQVQEIQQDLSSQLARLNSKIEKTIQDLTKSYDKV